jgi:prepilin-type N-terminal cleavage/methylation domain-containing protein/prepilin-type processing-associated H-X9-DG protein
MKRPAFTLIELLVVIAIIALLLAMSVPALHRVRDDARSTACRANIKNLLVELTLYEQANDTFPQGFWAMRSPRPPGGYPGSPATDVPGWYWFNFTESIGERSTHSTDILECPSKNLANPRLQGRILYGNYGINRSICRSSHDTVKYREAFSGPPLSIANVRKPGEALLLVDSGFAVTCWWQARDDPLMDFSGGTLEDTAYIPGMKTNKQRVLEQGQADDAIWGRHPSKTVNVGYVDGHAARSPADALLVEKTGEDQYHNRTPLWESP